MLHFKTYLSTIVVLLLTIISCNAQTTLRGLVLKEGRTTIIKSVIDMSGKQLILPKNITLSFEKGGCLRNGKIVGDNTSIVGYKQGIFDNVEISGQWNVKYISTDMFKDLMKVNDLKNVFALTNDNVKNVVKIDDREFRVAARRVDETILKVPSNTEVILNGTIKMLPNSFTNYYILELNGENIQIHGSGAIIGDKHSHTGTTGEWGMGVMLRECSNVDICDITIKDCWGDCIYIGDKSTNVHINNCTLDHGRRQGISITSAGKVLIENCTITNVGGTNPEYAIDVEPNENDIVESVEIKNVKVIDCKGGFLTWGGAKNCHINNVELYNCHVQGATKAEYTFNTSNEIKIINCTSDRKFKPINNKCISFKVIE